MKRVFQGKGRTLSAALAAAVLAGLTFGAVGSFAGEGKSLTAPIRYHRDDCGAPSDHKFVGKVKLTRSGDTVTAKATLHGAEPGEYHLVLFAPFILLDCVPVGDFGTFKVDASGEGNKSGSITLPSGGTHPFFVDAINATTEWDNETDWFDL